MSGKSAAALRKENTIELYNTSHKCENYVDFRQPLLSESQLLEFERLQSDKEKIKFVAVLENAYVGESGTSGKDFHHALDLKEKGNVEFRNKRYDKAIQFYSLALRKAPTADNGTVMLRISSASVVCITKIHFINYFLLCRRCWEKRCKFNSHIIC